MRTRPSSSGLERVAYELAQDNLAEGVRYIEVRFAPQLHCREGFSIGEVVRAVCRGLDRAKKEHNAQPAVKNEADIPFEYGIIACALRSFNEHMAPYYAQILHVMSNSPRKEVFAAASLELARAAVALAHHDGLPVVVGDVTTSAAQALSALARTLADRKRSLAGRTLNLTPVG